LKKGGYFTDYSILGRSPLFRGIPAGDFGVLLEHLKAETRSYKKGDLICHAGEHTNALGIVLTGSVTIESDDIFGNRSVLDKVGPGQVFAETYACVPNEPMLVNVTAAENCTVLFLKPAQILSPCAVNCRHHGKLIENLEKGIVFERSNEVVWICRNCGHIHVGKNAPSVCPVCKHPQAYFELRAENY